MQSFLAAAPQLANPRRLRSIRRALPIYLFSGSEEPRGSTIGEPSDPHGPLSSRRLIEYLASFLS